MLEIKAREGFLLNGDLLHSASIERDLGELRKFIGFKFINWLFRVPPLLGSPSEWG